jgi:hypothetical protein
MHVEIQATLISTYRPFKPQTLLPNITFFFLSRDPRPGSTCFLLEPGEEELAASFIYAANKAVTVVQGSHTASRRN